MYGSSYSSSSSSSSSYRSFSPYGSSTTSMSSPMDITPSPFSTHAPDASCAFPSWPRRSSLCDYDASEERATSYLSDEDLFPQDFEDDARSESSHSSGSPSQSPPVPITAHADVLEMQRQRAAYQREVMRLLMAEKEQRRRQAPKRRSSSSSSKKGHKSKPAAMTPIAEAD